MLQKLSDKQKEYINNSTHRWNIKYGATRSGKTYLDYYLIPLRIRERMGKEGLNFILGCTKGTIQRNIIEPMQLIWGETAIGNIGSDNTVDIFGEKVYCLGAETKSQAEKVRGSSIKYCYGDEVTTWSEDMFEMLKSRLDKPYSMFEGTTNPKSPSHWLKKFIDSDADIFSQHYSIDDNPFLDATVKADMKNEYQGVYYERYIDGNWVLAEGLIYPKFADALGTSDEPAEDIVLSIDYGTQNPFAALCWKKVDNVWYAYKGYYYGGRDAGVQKTDDEYGEAMDAFMEDEIKKYASSMQKIKVIVDPSAASFIALLKKKNWCKVLPADNAVFDGIRETATAMNLGIIKINPALKEWRSEAEGYVWEEGLDDKPVKENDHYMDSTRYFVKTMCIVPKFLKRQQHSQIKQENIEQYYL